MARSAHAVEGMNTLERRAVLALGGIYSTRMLGLFMVLPVLAVAALDYEGYSAQLAGLAIGAYGLTQALLQIPFGMASDRLGRKPVIAAGLVLFALGSVVAALADSMLGLVLGRALQGSGAVAAAVMALTADLTRDSQRTKAMAAIGASIGLAFAVAMVLGPLVAARFGLAGLFWLTALLALAGLMILLIYVPQPASAHTQLDAVPARAQFARVLADVELRRLDLGILILHLALTAMFVTLPLELRDLAGLPVERHWIVYLGVMLGAVTLMVPCVVLAERGGHGKAVFLGAIGVLAACLASIGLLDIDATGLVVLMVVFFAAFNTLEALLPSLVSRTAPAATKGTALGVYATCQFVGAFLGGACGGWLHQRFGSDAVVLFAATLVGAWLLVALGMGTPIRTTNRLLHVGSVRAGEVHGLTRRLSAVRGVREAVVVADEGVAYLKVERAELDEEALSAAVTASSAAA